MKHTSFHEFYVFISEVCFVIVNKDTSDCQWRLWDLVVSMARSGSRRVLVTTRTHKKRIYIKRKVSNELRTFSYFRNRFYKDNKMITWFLSDCARSIRTCRTRTAPAGWRAGGSSPAGTASPPAAPRWSPRSTSTPATHLTHTITTPTTVIIVYLSHTTVGHRPLSTLGYIIIITMQSSSKTIVSLFIPWVSNKVK